MALYHFNIYDGFDLPDRDGQDLPSLAAAKHVAVRLGGELIRDHADEFWRHGDWRMDVTDGDGLLLFALHFTAIDAPALYQIGSAQA